MSCNWIGRFLVVSQKTSPTPGMLSPLKFEVPKDKYEINILLIQIVRNENHKREWFSVNIIRNKLTGFTGCALFVCVSNYVDEKNSGKAAEHNIIF